MWGIGGYRSDSPAASGAQSALIHKRKKHKRRATNVAAMPTRPTISVLLSVSHTGTRTVVDLIQYTAASGKVAPGWVMRSLPGSRTIRADKGTSGWFMADLSFLSKSTTERFTVHTKEVVVQSTIYNWNHLLTSLLQLTWSSTIFRNKKS